MGDDGNQPKVVGNNITDILGVSGVTDRLLTFVERGIGPLGKPLVDRWRNRNQRKDLSLEIRALRDEGLVPAGAELTLDGRAAARIAFERIREQDNREAVAVEAIEEFRQFGDEEASHKEALLDAEPEWLDHFWNLAGRVTSADRQALWGRILARSAAGRLTSARALTLLSMLSGEEAHELERLAGFICSYQIGDGFADAGIMTEIFFAPGVAPSGLQEVNARLLKLANSPFFQLFGSIGLLVEGGWAWSAHPKPEGGVVRLAIAGKKYRIVSAERAVAPGSFEIHGFVIIGQGQGLSPIGREITSLIKAQPSTEYTRLLADGFRHCGWRLEEAE
jgi:hypothetical protein